MYVLFLFILGQIQTIKLSIWKVKLKSHSTKKGQTITTPSSVWVRAQLPVPSTLPLCHWSPDRPAVPQQRWWALPRLFWLLGSLHQSGRGGLHSLVPSENVMPNLNVILFYVSYKKKKKICHLTTHTLHYLSAFCWHSLQIGVGEWGLSLHLPLGHHVTPDDGHPLLYPK